MDQLLDSFAGDLACEKCSVRLEKTLLLEKDVVVVAVELERAVRVHFDGSRWVVWRAFALQDFGVVRVQGRVLIAFSSEVVEPVTEAAAVPYSDCVSPYSN